jgi:septum formation protein
LASGSPRRRDLLEAAGLEFEVIVPPISEPDESNEQLSPSALAEGLAYFKARSVAEKNPDAVVLAADTVVATGDRVLGKPSDEHEARQMLSTLSGTRHQVITAVALLNPDRWRLIASDITYVTMRKMTDDEIEAYIESGEWEGKAGAYAIQETADKFVESVEGSFTNVVGLPMELLQRMLKELRNHTVEQKGR